MTPDRKVTRNDLDRAAARLHDRSADTSQAGRRDRIHDFDPWMDFILAAWMFGAGGFLLGQGNWAGFYLLPFAGLWTWLGVRGIRWRWKSDISWRDLHR